MAWLDRGCGVAGLVVLSLAVGLAPSPASSGPRDRLTIEEMFGRLGEGPVGNHYFMPTAAQGITAFNA